MARDVLPFPFTWGPVLGALVGRLIKLVGETAVDTLDGETEVATLVGETGAVTLDGDNVIEGTLFLAGDPGGDELNFTGEVGLTGGVPDGKTFTPPNGALDCAACWVCIDPSLVGDGKELTGLVLVGRADGNPGNCV